MADPVDQLDEQAQVEAELRRLKESQETPPEPPEGTDTGLPPVQPPADKPLIEVKPEEQAPVEEKKEEGTAPAPEKKHAERTPEEQAREGTLRRLLREKERELAALRAERNKTEEKPPEKPKEPTYEEDPAEYLKRRIDAVDQENRQLREQLQQREVRDSAQRAEDSFMRDHPDYPEARDYLLQNETQEWELSGLANVQQQQLRGAIELARQGDARYRGYLDHISRIASNPEIEEAAERNNRTAEEEAIYRTARDTYINSRAQNLSPEGIYGIAQRRGYRPKTAEPPKDAGESARERVLRAKQISDASRSLSEVSSGESGEGPKIIRNRNQVLNLNDDELDALITSNRFREL